MQIVLGNKTHPEYGVATIPFPIPKEEYGHVLEVLAPLEIGDAIKQDCEVLECLGYYTVLNRMVGTNVNLDELDYLAKRIDSFDIGEAAQFQAMAEKLDLTDIKDFINLTFCCQQATVINDFTDLEKVGREHYMNLNGGCALSRELEDLNGRETALMLISSGEGMITPYGVVYDNGMKMEQLYDGKVFPEYLYDASAIAVEVKTIDFDPSVLRSTCLFLPMPEEQIDRMLQRIGIEKDYDFKMELTEYDLPDEIIERLNIPYENLYDLNRMCEIISPMDAQERKKLAAAVIMAKAEYACEIYRLAKYIDHFDFFENIKTAEEYGKYMIRDSGHYEFDPELHEFYDYEKYGKQRMEWEAGEFSNLGYIAYYGLISMDKLMAEDPAEAQDFQMGGM